METKQFWAKPLPTPAAHNMDTVVALPLDQLNTARNIVGKLWTTIISPALDPVEVVKAQQPTVVTDWLQQTELPSRLNGFEKLDLCA